jgi:hypothetical protein
MLDVLKQDFARIPELMGRSAASQEPEPVLGHQPAVQLGLF